MPKVTSITRIGPSSAQCGPRDVGLKELIRLVARTLTQELKPNLTAVQTLRHVDDGLVDLFLDVARCSNGPVLAVSPTLLLSTTEPGRDARSHITDEDHDLLLDLIAHDGQPEPTARELNVRLARGTQMEVRCHLPDHGIDGAVFELLVITPNADITTPNADIADLIREAVPGPSVAASRTRDQLQRFAGSSADVLVAAEAGAGKATVGAALFAVAGQSFTTVDLRDEATWQANLAAAIQHGQGLLLLHIDELEPESEGELIEYLDTARQRGSRAVATCRGPLSLRHRDLATRFTARLWLSPLRDRLEDIPDIVLTLPRRTSSAPSQLSTEALRSLWSYTWPGNIAELSGVIRDAWSRAVGPYLDSAAIRLPSTTDSQSRPRLSSLQETERDAIVAALRRCAGNKNNTAAMLGIARSTLYCKLRALGVSNDIASPFVSDWRRS